MNSLIKSAIILGTTEAIRLTRRSAPSDILIEPSYVTTAPANQQSSVPPVINIGLNSSRVPISEPTSAVQVKDGEWIFIVIAGICIAIVVAVWSYIKIHLLASQHFGEPGLAAMLAFDVYTIIVIVDCFIPVDKSNTRRKKVTLFGDSWSYPNFADSWPKVTFSCRAIIAIVWTPLFLVGFIWGVCKVGMASASVGTGNM